jgi:hypothetical protein
MENCKPPADLSMEGYRKQSRHPFWSISSGLVQPQRGPELFDMFKNLLTTTNIQIRLMQSGKRGMAGVFIRCRRAHSHRFFEKILFNDFSYLTGNFIRNRGMQKIITNAKGGIPDLLPPHIREFFLLSSSRIFSRILFALTNS